MLKMFMVLAISAIAMSILALQKRPNCTKAVILPVVVLLMVSLTGCSDVSGYSGSSGYSDPWGEFYGPYGYAAGYAAARAQSNLASEEQKKNNNEDANNEAISEDVSEDEDVSESTDEDTNSETISEDVGEDEDAQDSAGKDHQIYVISSDSTQERKTYFYFDGRKIDDEATGWELYNAYPRENCVTTVDSDGKVVIQIFSSNHDEDFNQSTSRTHPNIGGPTVTDFDDGGATGYYQPEQCVDRSISTKHDDYDVDYWITDSLGK